jgi:hypothetical protein
MINWLVENWQKILEAIGAVVTAATFITALTPTPKDDTFLAKVKKVLAIFGLLNPDKSFIGKAEEVKK